jgi:hypothetical protein
MEHTPEAGDGPLELSTCYIEVFQVRDHLADLLRHPCATEPALDTAADMLNKKAIKRLPEHLVNIAVLAHKPFGEAVKLLRVRVHLRLS